MDDPHPLAIIPLQKDPLLLSDTSSSSSTASSPNNRSCNQSGLDSFSCQSLVPVRALVPHAGSSLSKSTSPTDWRDDDSVRSEDDTALMRSLISLMPHEQADSQVCRACHRCETAEKTAALRPSRRPFERYPVSAIDRYLIKNLASHILEVQTRSRRRSWTRRRSSRLCPLNYEVPTLASGRRSCTNRAYEISL